MRKCTTRRTKPCFAKKHLVEPEALRLYPKDKWMQRSLLDKHYLRKYGANAYYGQD